MHSRIRLHGVDSVTFTSVARWEVQVSFIISLSTACEKTVTCWCIYLRHVRHCSRCSYDSSSVSHKLLVQISLYDLWVWKKRN